MKFGGVEKHVERLAVGLAKRGHKVFVYTRPWYTPRSLKVYQGVKLISLQSIRTKNFDAITHTLRACFHALKKDYDIIHFHGVGPSLLAWIPRLFKPSARVIITFHCIDRRHQKWGWFARFILYLGEITAVKFAHDTITVSKTLQMYCSEKYNANTTYIPNGIDLPKKIAANQIKKKYGLKKDGYILFLSRLVKHKGAQYLIDAYNQLKTDKKLVIAGGSAFTDDYIKEIKEQALNHSPAKAGSGSGQANNNPDIIFTGNITGGSTLWKELYSNAYLMVHPSESEGLPIVVLEGMSFGLGVLVSDIPENMEAINGGFGFSFYNKNIQDLKNKLQYLFDCPELVRKVGADARVHVEKNYNWKDIVVSVESVYKDVLLDHASKKMSRKAQCVSC